MTNETLNILDINMAMLERNVLIHKASLLRTERAYRNTSARHRLGTIRNRAESDAFYDSIGKNVGWWQGFTFERETPFGTLTIEVKVEPDTDGGYYSSSDFSNDDGEVVNPEWYYSEYGRCDHAKFFTPPSGTTVKELFEWNHRAGMNKHDALVEARKSLQEEAKIAAANESEYGVTVTILDADGSELASDSLWGCQLEQREDLFDVLSGNWMLKTPLEDAIESLTQAEYARTHHCNGKLDRPTGTIAHTDDTCPIHGNTTKD